MLPFITEYYHFPVQILYHMDHMVKRMKRKANCGRS